MKKLYPRKSKRRRFKDYYIPPTEIIKCSTIATDREIFPLISTALSSTLSSVCLAFFQMSLNEAHLKGLSLQIFSILKSLKYRGVNIRVILNQNFANTIQHTLNCKTVKLLSAIGIPIGLADPHNVLHAKLIIIDGESAIVGSMNMTVTSLCENHEVAVYIRSPLVEQILVPYFEEIWQRSKN